MSSPVLHAWSGTDLVVDEAGLRITPGTLSLVYSCPKLSMYSQATWALCMAPVCLYHSHKPSLERTRVQRCTVRSRLLSRARLSSAAVKQRHSVLPMAGSSGMATQNTCGCAARDGHRHHILARPRDSRRLPNYANMSRQPSFANHANMSRQPSFANYASMSRQHHRCARQVSGLAFHKSTSLASCKSRAFKLLCVPSLGTDRVHTKHTHPTTPSTPY